LLTATTRLVGLIGKPVSESLSPRMQNAAFAARGLDWAYVPLPVEPEQLEAAALGLVALGFAGANVTTPYKTAVLSYCDALDETAERAGSVNTLVVRDGRLLGSTTDGQAVVGAVEPGGASVLVLGAGGAAQAVTTALAEAGAASFTIAARSAERAHALAVRLRTLFAEVEIQAEDRWPPVAGGVTVVVNATPIRDEVLVDVSERQTVVDLAYNADGQPTALVAAARERGCTIVDGLDVLVAQGAASFERWTGIPAPVDVMRAAITLGA
jgi:shikimate dehydrogenase